MNGYFFDEAGDDRMVNQNRGNWEALMRLIKAEAIKTDPMGRPALPNKPWNILDIGCHTGGLLFLLDLNFKIASLNGVEPLPNARERANYFLPKANFYESIRDVPSQSADLIVSHETLYLVENIYTWAPELKRILRPDGGAFIALGSHSENTAWLRWRTQLEKKYGHISYVHKPMVILRVGEDAGFDMELHRLHPDLKKSFRYSPPEDGWGEFISAEEALEFQRQKYVFVFYPKR